MKIKAVIFDWDGTLFNSMEYKRENFTRLFEGHSISHRDLIDFHQKYSGIPRKELINKCLQHFQLQTLDDGAYQKISAKYTQMNIESSSQAVPFEDVEPGLMALKERGIKLFVSSSSAHDELTLVSKKSGMRPYFEEVLGSQHGLNKGPDHVDYLCQKYHLTKCEILFLGDDEQDLILGEKAGVKTLRIRRKNKKGAEIQSLKELLDVLE